MSVCWFSTIGRACSRSSVPHRPPDQPTAARKRAHIAEKDRGIWREWANTPCCDQLLRHCGLAARLVSCGLGRKARKAQHHEDDATTTKLQPRLSSGAIPETCTCPHGGSGKAAASFGAYRAFVKTEFIEYGCHALRARPGRLRKRCGRHDLHDSQISTMHDLDAVYAAFYVAAVREKCARSALYSERARGIGPPTTRPYRVGVPRSRWVDAVDLCGRGRRHPARLHIAITQCGSHSISRYVAPPNGGAEVAQSL